MIKKATEYIKGHNHVLAILVFIPVYVFYFIICRLRDPIWVVHSPVDDMIPFLPWFVFFYYLWYLYISLPLLWLAAHSRVDMFRMIFYLLIGTAVCHTVFLIAPSEIDFRAVHEAEMAERGGVLGFLFGIIYGADLPRNVFPSMHCFESVAIHIALCHSETGRKHRKWLYPLSLFSAVMICLSTVFVKQHSFYDLISGVALAFIILPVVYIPKWKFLQKRPDEE